MSLLQGPWFDPKLELTLCGVSHVVPESGWFSSQPHKNILVCRFATPKLPLGVKECVIVSVHGPLQWTDKDKVLTEHERMDKSTNQSINKHWIVC